MTIQRLNNRLFDVKAGDPAYSVKSSADDVAEVVIYDEIGGWGIYADQFKRDLDKIESSTIVLRVNSPGGSVFEGVTIANALSNHSAKIEVHVDGVAASIASIIAMAGDKIHMAENAYMMIHNPWTIAIGDSSEMLKAAELLEDLRGTLAKTYAKRTGQPEEEVFAWMDEETWFNAEAALDAGLIDSIEETVPGPSARFDLSNFAKAPEQPVEEAVEGEAKAEEENEEQAGKDAAMLRNRLALKERE